MKYNPKLPNIQGFSLVELSVVLAIIGITLAGALDLATRKTESDHITETNLRMDAIEQALAVFVINNQRLPCPADATLAPGSAGSEGTPSSSGCAGSNFNSGYIYSGMVPTTTLNIDDKYMVDDWGRRFSYVVDMRFANNSSTTNCSSTTGSQVCFKNTTIPQSTDTTAITINDSTGAARTDIAVYSLISYGKNGYGAWKSSGSSTRLTASTDTDEKENAGNDRTAATPGFNSIFVQKDTTTTFDDIVRYSTKALIIDNVNGVTDSTTCTSAFDANTLNVASTTTDPCPNTDAAKQTKCYNLASQVNKLCLQP